MSFCALGKIRFTSAINSRFCGSITWNSSSTPIVNIVACWAINISPSNDHLLTVHLHIFFITRTRSASATAPKLIQHNAQKCKLVQFSYPHTTQQPASANHLNRSEPKEETKNDTAYQHSREEGHAILHRMGQIEIPHAPSLSLR